MKCKFCDSTDIVKNGFVKKTNELEEQRYLCNNCKRTFTEVVRNYSKQRLALHLFIEKISLKMISKILNSEEEPKTISSWINNSKINIDKYKKSKLDFKTQFEEVANSDELRKKISHIIRNNSEAVKSGLLIIGLNNENPISSIIKINHQKKR